MTLANSPFSPNDIERITEHLLKNIASSTKMLTKCYNNVITEAIPGAVVAAPALPNNVFSQDYFFHWVRDGAIVIRQIAHLYLNAKASPKKDNYRQILLDYLNFVKKIQAQPRLNGIDILGEPKFNIDGTLWTGEWSRPQNDGAAYQALALIEIITILLDEGQNSVLITSLYDPNVSNSLLKTNLEYCAANWSVKTIGPWEELYGDHFSVQVVQRAALIKGAALATRLNDSGAADYYHQQALHITNALGNYWNPSLGYHFETLHEQAQKGGGIATAVLIGLVYGQINRLDDHFSVSNIKSLSTAYYVREVFERLYQINVAYHLKDKIGVLIGRYHSDIYDGNQSIYGNPWYLCSNLLAAFYYLVAKDLLNGQEVIANYLVQQFLHQVAPDLNIPLNTCINSQQPQFKKLIEALVVQADGVLEAVKSHTTTIDDTGLHMSEQIDRASGAEVSAPDLSWSYATLLTATTAREEVMELLKEKQ